MPKESMDKTAQTSNFFTQVEINGLVDVDVKDIFEFLNIDRWCCRKILLTVSTFDEQLFALPSMR